MPLYEYSCSVCGSFEVLQKADAKPVNCDPDCKQKSCPKSATRLVSAAAFHLKGGGWYKTDYAPGAGGGAKSTEKATPEASTTTTSTSETKAESKSTETKPAKKESGSGGGGGGCGSGCGCHK